MRAAGVASVATVWVFFGRGWAATVAGALVALWWLSRRDRPRVGRVRRRVNLARLHGPAWVHLCTYCWAPARTWDHVVPLSRGGTDTADNMTPACVRCNSVKGANTPEDLWARIGRGAPYPGHWPTTAKGGRQ